MDPESESAFADPSSSPPLSPPLSPDSSSSSGESREGPPSPLDITGTKPALPRLSTEVFKPRYKQVSGGKKAENGKTYKGRKDLLT